MNLRLAAVAGSAFVVAQALGQGVLDFEVKPAAGTTWSTSLTANPGDSIDVRVKVSYNGTGAALGFGSMEFQPVLSNWATGDTFTPVTGVGGGRTTPLGEVPDAPTLYGRVIPYGYRSMAGISGMVNNNISGVNYLRIAQTGNTSWIGQGTNVNGANGIIIAQLSDLGRVAGDLPFDSRTANVVVFKFNITLGSSTTARTLTADAPLAGFAEGPGGQIKWYANMGESTGSLQGVPTVHTAQISVIPAPASLAGLVGLVAVRRKRR